MMHRRPGGGVAVRDVSSFVATSISQGGGPMGESIPLVCQDWADTKAAYRFFSEERVIEEHNLGAHFQSTCDRFVNLP